MSDDWKGEDKVRGMAPARYHSSPLSRGTARKRAQEVRACPTCNSLLPHDVPHNRCYTCAVRRVPMKGPKT